MRWSVFWMLAVTVTAEPADPAAVLAAMDAKAGHFGEVSRQIWEFAELGYKEVRSAELLKQELRKAGFTIEDQVGGIPTAFVASWGQGKPVIGILGEYDALPELSQQNTPVKKAVVEGAPGHGCGHNLLGTAAAFAAISVKQWLEGSKTPGTVRFYGSPAEEGGGGKVYMARAGAFQDLDIALTWHPFNRNGAGLESSLANVNAKFRFHGRASHAAGAPEAGRSALDGLLLMNHAVELLREHVPSTTRIHYIITKGGAAPNIVPEFAEGYFYARSPSMVTLQDVWARMVKCAEAGALATETRMEMELVNSVYNLLPNEPLARLFDRHLNSLGGLQYTLEERRFAETLRTSFQSDNGLGMEERIQPLQGEGSLMFGSTDVADVSWIVPTAQFYAAAFVPGASPHSWQATACAGSTIGRKAMLLAAKTLALSAMDLFSDEHLRKAARDDFDRRRSGHTYRSLVPAENKAPLDYRGK